MADWVLNLTGNLGTKSAQEAAQVGKLGAALKAEEAALKRLEVARLRAGSGTEKDIKATAKLNAEITQSKARIENLAKSGARVDLEKSFLPKGGVGNAIFGALDKAFLKLSKVAVAGVLSVAAATTGASVALGTFGFHAADAGRSARLLNEAADLAGGGGHKLDGVIRQVANSTPLAKEQIAGLARELSVARLSGRQAQLTLEASAVASSALGDSAGDSIVQIAKQSREIRRFTLGARDIYREYKGLAGTGLKGADVVGALAKQMKTSVPAAEAALRSGKITVEQGLMALETATKAKFGGVVARQMLSLDVQTRKLGEHLGDLFSGVNAEPALKGLHEVLGVFDSTTYAGDTLKSLLTAVFNDLSGSAEAAAPRLKSFFLGLEAGALQVYIAIKPTLQALGGMDTTDADGISSSFKAGEAAAKALGTALADVLTLMNQIGNAAGVIKDIASIVIRPKSVTVATGAADSAETIAMGAKIDAGITKGIADNQGGPIGALLAMNAAMQAAWTGPKGIDSHSPSKKYERSATNIPLGVTKGVERGTPGVEAAVIDMANAPLGGSSSTDNSRSVRIENVNVSAIGDASLRRVIDERLYSVLKAVADGGAPRTGISGSSDQGTVGGGVG